MAAETNRKIYQVPSAIKSKMYGDESSFEKYIIDIDLKNLTLKKRILLNLPGILLKFLLKVNLILVQVGWSKSVFK